MFTTQLAGSQFDGSNMWIHDNGASRHMVLLKSRLIKAKSLDVPIIIVLRDGQSLEATHREQATIFPNVRLSNVLSVRDLKENLFLISMASTVNGAKVIIENGLCQVIKDKRVAFNTKKRGGVF